MLAKKAWRHILFVFVVLASASLLFSSLEADNNLGKKAASDQFYHFNTEVLAANEMRVVALGTGATNFRPAQAASSWLVELGNGEKFLFDVGTGSMRNLGGLEIPFEQLDKLFISHLHVDHIGDLDALFVSGWISLRTTPLKIWGPSGIESNMGTRHVVEHMMEMFNWDLTGRRGILPVEGSYTEITEFDYSKPGVVYNRNGVVVKAWPAIHVLDGPVSYSLEWQGIKFVFSGDTVPNRWFVEYATNADLLVHECYLTVDQLIKYKHYGVGRAEIVSRVVHTPPDICGKLFSKLEPKMAVANHYFNDQKLLDESEAEIRKSYKGSLAMADDFMVWNITSDSIKVRRGIPVDFAWPPKPNKPTSPPPEKSKRPKVSDWLEAGRLAL